MQNPYQQPNPSSQPYPYPHTRQDVPPYPVGRPFGAPEPPPDKRKKTTTVVAVCAATVVVATVVVTGVVVLKDEGVGNGRADHGTGGRPSSASASSPAPSGTDARHGSGGVEPTIAGWKAVVSPAHGTAFDVPADWEVDPDISSSGYPDNNNPDKRLVQHAVPAFYKAAWCSIDADGSGLISDFELGSAGVQGVTGAKDTREIAEKVAPLWVYAAFTQPDKNVVTRYRAVDYTTEAGVRGSYVKAYSEGAEKPNKCAGDGQAVVFCFKNSRGDFVAWDIYARTGVPGALSDDLIMRILSTVRLAGDPTDPPP
ncbi:hypothetical protein ACIRQY_18110 [Streptomyces sp. NPDC101490]|uniref:hypothetical protein n=1 Tax=Streptomyces sp. NPDC101490 TaxID=3366143 RepID=UPI00382F223E